jgi:hypothetical protein
MTETLDGASRDVLPLLFLSIDYAPIIPQTWPPRLRIILDNWPYFSDAQKERLTGYMALTWRLSEDRRFFAWAIHSPVDELIIRYFLRDHTDVQAELTQLINHEQHH